MPLIVHTINYASLDARVLFCYENIWYSSYIVDFHKAGFILHKMIRDFLFP